MTDDAAWPLAQHVCRTGYRGLPASTIQPARRDILDIFGCMLAGGRKVACCCAGPVCRHYRPRC